MPVNEPNTIRDGLAEDEIWWRDHQPWFDWCGYRLRPGVTPGWVPSWVGKEVVHSLCEDYGGCLNVAIQDLVRTDDGQIVMMKMMIIRTFLLRLCEPTFRDDWKVTDFLGQVFDRWESSRTGRVDDSTRVHTLVLRRDLPLKAHRDSLKRPTMDEVITQYADIRKALSDATSAVEARHWAISFGAFHQFPIENNVRRILT
ncbi:hypothetical protein K443DRAFT_124992 [Laccaria amethystina LaAM-08-1]|uniref:Uncharacterized protein n=1 Tax=Laccaria amethystina LaAM-08-1 TaxID=1095629 RepID=A0A0C9WT81_9AGAR|nr:hypothetical protein K443DRAFT_124992 [Laccaria amethystina LaAM-08-1]